MARHIIFMAVCATLVVLAIFLPFMPGEYDGFSALLSSTVQMFCYSGLALVLTGITWLVVGTRNDRTVRRMARVTLVVLSFVMAAVTITPTMHNSPSLSVIILIITILMMIKLSWRVKFINKDNVIRLTFLPFYMMSIPLIGFLAILFFIEDATSYSRTIAMTNCAPMIEDIEKYKERVGHYPVSLQSEWGDYKPRIRGVERYYYELNGEAYNVYFEQFSYKFGTREFVMYNKLDQQEFTTHDMDLLQLEPSAIYRGYHFSEKLDPHWKRFEFD